MKYFWIYKGTSNFCSDLVLGNDCETFEKQKPEGFYDIVSLEDTVEGGIKVIAYEELNKIIEPLLVALEYYSNDIPYHESVVVEKMCFDDCPNDCNKHSGVPYVQKIRPAGHGSTVAIKALKDYKEKGGIK